MNDPFVNLYDFRAIRENANTIEDGFEPITYIESFGKCPMNNKGGI